MRLLTWLALCAVAACSGFPSLPPLSGSLSITASPSDFKLHANDTREARITVTNTSGTTLGALDLDVVGLTLGTMTLTSNECTADLAPGASCTAIGQLVATVPGQSGFQITASAGPGDAAIAELSLTVMAACGSACGANANCCASSVVPGNAPGATLAGTEFYRSYDVAVDGQFASMAYPATVSDFRLDTYEVTVGRFRAFVEAGMGTATSAPPAGAGAHAAIAGSGWDASWNSDLPADQAALVAAVTCDAAFHSWTDTATGGNESKPMNCISWYEAMAFCIWDGGYLPTEAEWNYAASGGSEQRAFPWSSPPASTTIDCSYANYRIDVPAGTSCVDAVNRVGSESPRGDGRWGQADLAGNVNEWVLDSYSSDYPTTTCDDCANLMPTVGQTLRGGTFAAVAVTTRAGFRVMGAPMSHSSSRGVRCARSP